MIGLARSAMKNRQEIRVPDVESIVTDESW